MDDLRPCPFCGGKARYRTGCGVECADCFANIVEARRIKDTVVAEWNRRSDAALSEAQAHIKRLEVALDECEHATATIVRLEAENAGLKAAILALSKDAAARAAQSDGDGE